MKGQRSSQGGMVLVTSLVILMILTMLGLSSVQGTSIQELISRNQRDSNIAFNAAETTIINAESILETLSATNWESIVESAYATSASPKVYNAEPSGAFLGNTGYPADNDYANSLPASLPNVAMQPVYFVEFLGTVITDEDRLNIDNIGQNPNTCCTKMFRITARGAGGTNSAVAIVQSTYGKRF